MTYLINPSPLEQIANAEGVHQLPAQGCAHQRATLGVGLAIVVLFYRYNFPKRLFGRYVQEQMFTYLSWAVPLLAVSTALAFILVAAS